MIKILHTSDWHIGCNFSSFNEKEKAKKLLYRSILDIVKTANTQNVDAVLICGDIFDTLDVSFDDKNYLLNILCNFNAKVFIVLGNHDYYFKASLWDNLNLPENVHLFKQNQFSYVEINDARIYGASFTNIYDNILIDNINLDENKINIGLVHSDILTKSKYNSYTKTDIANSKFDYLAFGHNHKFSEILKADNTYYACSGNISATGFDETSEKGFIIATISKEEKSFAFYKSSGLNLIEKEVDITKILSNDEFILYFTGENTNNIYLNITIIGILNFEFDKMYIQNQLEKHFFGINIIFMAKKPEELWIYIDDDTIIGEFTRLMRNKYENSNDKSQIINALKIGLDALLT